MDALFNKALNKSADLGLRNLGSHFFLSSVTAQSTSTYLYLYTTEENSWFHKPRRAAKYTIKSFSPALHRWSDRQCDWRYSFGRYPRSILAKPARVPASWVDSAYNSSSGDDDDSGNSSRVDVNSVRLHCWLFGDFSIFFFSRILHLP